MKIPYVPASIALCVSLNGQVIRSIDGRALQLPKQFLVTHEGLTWITSGSREPTTVVWSRIDLQRLALEEPEIEEARHEAILSSKDVYFTASPKPNFYRELLSHEINVQFKQKWKSTTTGRVDYNISTTGYVSNGAGYPTQNSAVAGRTSEVTRYIDQTRPALSTTVEGLLLRLGEDDRLDSHRLIADLRESGAVMQNIRMLFMNLSEVYPEDYEIPKTVRALDRLISESTTSVDAMRQLRSFVVYARNKKIE